MRTASLGGPLLFRVDAGVRMGTGHVMRCLALAQSWQDAGGQAVFLLAECPARIEERLRAERIEVLRQEQAAGSRDDADDAARLAQRLGAAWIVVDGYHFDADFHQRLRAGGTPLLALDDGFPFAFHSADLILNQNLYADESLYPSRQPHTRLLLGPRYLLLRQEFLPWRDTPRAVPPLARRLLITLGGADPDNVSLKALFALSMLRPDTFDATVLVGPANPHLEALQRAGQCCPCPVRVKTAGDDVPGLLARADLAIAAGGTTTWEMAFMGLPAIVLSLADNQRAVAAAAATAGSACNLGWHADATPAGLAAALAELHSDQARRGAMAQAGQQLIDGQGVERVRQHLRGERVRLRRARAADAELLWTWANDAEVRSRGFHPAAIPWQDHVRWLESKLRAADAHLFVGADSDDVPVGQLRLDATAPGEAVISVSVAPGSRGNGWGTELILAGTRWGLTSLGLQRIHAYVKPDNAASLAAFRKAGYHVVSSTLISGQHAIHAACESQTASRQAG